MLPVKLTIAQETNLENAYQEYAAILNDLNLHHGTLQFEDEGLTSGVLMVEINYDLSVKIYYSKEITQIGFFFNPGIRDTTSKTPDRFVQSIFAYNSGHEPSWLDRTLPLQLIINDDFKNKFFSVINDMIKEYKLVYEDAVTLAEIFKTNRISKIPANAAVTNSSYTNAVAANSSYAVVGKG